MQAETTSYNPVAKEIRPRSHRMLALRSRNQQQHSWIVFAGIDDHLIYVELLDLFVARVAEVFFLAN